MNEEERKCAKCGGTKFKKKGTYSNTTEGEIQMWQCLTKGCGKCIRGEVIGNG